MAGGVPDVRPYLAHAHAAALPLRTVEDIARVRACDLGRLMGDDAETFEYGGHSYKVRHIASLVNGQSHPLPADDSYVPLVLVRAGEHSTALLSDEMLGAREIVVKTLGPQFSGVCGVAGATIEGTTVFPPVKS